MTSVATAALRKRCQRRVDHVLATVGRPQPFDINVLLDRLEHARGRPIDLCPISWRTGDSSGAWQAHADHDVIAYAANTSGIHQDHIILHEIGHMIAEHRGRCVLSETDAQRIAPDLSSTVLAHMLDRAAGAAEEAEAETFAMLVHQRLRQRHQVATELPDHTARKLSRVEAVFGG